MKKIISKNKISLALSPPFFFFLPCAFALGLIGCTPRQGCMDCLWPLLQGDSENEVTASQ